jgi:hypothetical protein
LHAYTERFLFSPNVSNDSKQRWLNFSHGLVTSTVSFL